jgi:hypothetical protein
MPDPQQITEEVPFHILDGAAKKAFEVPYPDGWDEAGEVVRETWRQGIAATLPMLRRFFTAQVKGAVDLATKLAELEAATLEEGFYGHDEAEAVAHAIQDIRAEVMGDEDAEVKRPAWWEREKESEFEAEATEQRHRQPRCGGDGADHALQEPERSQNPCPGCSDPDCPAANSTQQVEEEPRYTLEQVREGLLSHGARVAAAQADAEARRDKSRTYPSTAAIKAALDHFTQQPAGVGADEPSEQDPLSPATDGAAQSPAAVSADSDGNHQPLGGDADADQQARTASVRRHVAGGGSGQGAGSALALDEIEQAIWRGVKDPQSAPDHWPEWLIGAALAVHDLTQQPSDGQEGGIEEGAGS